MNDNEIPRFTELFQSALQRLPDQQVEQMLSLYADEQRRRKVEASIVAFSMKPEDVVLSVLDQVEAADYDALGKAAEALDERYVYVYDEGAGMFDIVLVES